VALAAKSLGLGEVRARRATWTWTATCIKSYYTAVVAEAAREMHTALCRQVFLRADE